MSVKLLPCPFCGHEAETETMSARKGYEADIHCNNCLVALHTITFDTKEEAVEQAIAAWNRRVDPANPPLTEEELYQKQKQHRKAADASRRVNRRGK